MKKILPLVIMLSCMLFAREEITNQKESVWVKDAIEKEKNKEIGEYFTGLKSNLKLLDKEGILDKEIDKEMSKKWDVVKNQKEFKAFRIFYFITETTSKDLIKNFSYEIQKLKELDENIEGIVITNGLIGGNFEGMSKYVKDLQNKGVKKINVSFSPWAFEHFKLDSVPAFALSYCEKEYRFKSCKHKFLARGEMSLTNFFEIVSDENNGYKKYYQKLIEAK